MESLQGSQQFENVFANADAKQHSRDVFLLLKKNQLGHHRLGLISAKKKLKRAVDRNRFRRVVRESVRQLDDLEGLDIIAMAKGLPDDLHAASFTHRFQQTLEKTCKKLP